MPNSPMQRPIGIGVLAVALGWLAVAGFGNAFVWRSIPDAALPQSSAAPAIPMLHAAASPYFTAIAIVYASTGILSCVALWRMRPWASQAFDCWILSFVLLCEFIVWNLPEGFSLVSSLFMLALILVLGIARSYVRRSVVKEGIDDGGKAASLVGNATARDATSLFYETALKQRMMRDDRMQRLRLSAKEWLGSASKTRAGLVPCEVSAPVRDGGKIMAELIRIDCWIQDTHDQDSRTLIFVGIPLDNLILFEKWLARTFRGNATSTLLPINGDP